MFDDYFREQQPRTDVCQAIHTATHEPNVTSCIMWNEINSNIRPKLNFHKSSPYPPPSPSHVLKAPLESLSNGSVSFPIWVVSNRLYKIATCHITSRLTHPVTFNHPWDRPVAHRWDRVVLHHYHHRQRLQHCPFPAMCIICRRTCVVHEVHVTAITLNVSTWTDKRLMGQNRGLSQPLYQLGRDLCSGCSIELAHTKSS